MSRKRSDPLSLRDEGLQIPTWMIHALKSGEITLSTGGTEALELKIENKKIDINILNKEFLKEALRLEVEPKRKSLLGRLTQLNDIAEKLKEDKITVRLSHKGRVVITLGSEANPKLSQLITRTNAIEINNLRGLIQLIA